MFVAFFAPYDFTGKAITVKAELTDTIGVIKRKMAEKEHIPPDQHNLMFAGEQLQVGAALPQGVQVGDRDAMDALHDVDVAARVGPVHLRHVDQPAVGKIPPQL